MTCQVLVTGATGFIGRVLCDELLRGGNGVIALTRHSTTQPFDPRIVIRPIGDLADVTDWRPVLEGVQVVVHLAGRAHRLGESRANSQRLYQLNNTEVTKSLAAAAATCGVQQLVYMSSVKVFGDGPFSGPLKAADAPVPSDEYGISKRSAEIWLMNNPGTSPRISIIRPPLVYGPGVRANFLRLMRLTSLGIPLPLGGLKNLRSLISVWNLADLIILLIKSPGKSNGIWHASDGQDCSTSQLIEAIALQMGKVPRLFSAPDFLIRNSLRAIGRGAEYNRLFGSLQLDISATLEGLSWKPPLSLEEGLARTVSWYQGRSNAVAV